MNVLINSLLFSAPSVRPRCDCPEGLLPAPAGGACRNGRGRGDHQDCAARQEQRAPGECSSSGTSAFHFHAHLIDVIAVLCCPSLSTVHFRLSFPYPAPTFTALTLRLCQLLLSAPPFILVLLLLSPPCQLFSMLINFVNFAFVKIE